MKKSVTNFIVDKFYGGKVLKAVVKATLCTTSIDKIKQFMEEHEHIWDTDTDEQKFIYTEIHGKYCNLMENILEEPLRKSNTTINEFLSICTNLRDESDGHVQTFIDLLLTVNKYEIFSELMQCKDKREYYFYILKGWAAHHVNNADNSNSKTKK